MPGKDTYLGILFTPDRVYQIGTPVYSPLGVPTLYPFFFKPSSLLKVIFK